MAITGRDSHILFNDVSYSGYGREVFQDYCNHGSLVERQQPGFQDIKEKIWQWYSHVVRLDLKKLTESKLLFLMSVGVNLYGTMFRYTLYVETFDDEIALSIIGQKYSSLMTKVWGKATHPYFESFADRRLRFAISLLDQNTPDKEQLYRYTTTDFFTCKPIAETQNKLLLIAENLEKNKTDLARNAEIRKKEVSRYISWLKTLSPDESRLAVYTQMAIETRDQRKDPYNQLQTIQSLLGQELLKRAGIDTILTPYLVADDLTGGLKTLIIRKSEFPKRPDGFVAFYGKDGQLASVTENITETLDYIKQKNLEQEANLSVGQIKGLIGSKGVAVGPVCIVPDVTRAGNFKDGDVLVTGMTRPEFVVFMKRACAIVTDEGGITCHAAIVSRELHLPCLIGTKIATKVLHNGDKVEVDADHGFVRILKRK